MNALVRQVFLRRKLNRPATLTLVSSDAPQHSAWVGAKDFGNNGAGPLEKYCVQRKHYFHKNGSSRWLSSYPSDSDEHKGNIIQSEANRPRKSKSNHSNGPRDGDGLRRDRERDRFSFRDTNVESHSNQAQFVQYLDAQTRELLREARKWKKDNLEMLPPHIRHRILSVISHWGGLWGKEHMQGANTYQGARACYALLEEILEEDARLSVVKTSKENEASQNTKEVRTACTLVS
jgi:hypothetical protein